ncbi:F-actin-capping protein subunit beta isoform X2 [Hylobates moloch]|uniref:F-actin-capping protein subunit beta isoform X2 n=1 Tax=Hylobates moloch TaxID=81572 RepID=UPI0026772FD8|nr:F-actin-capping protein subunit beta isoform X2 [Hylobates moloch]
MSDQQLDCALDLMRRLPPQQIEKNLSDLIDLVPSLCEDLLSSVDQPLKIARDKVVGKDYLLCDYNRDGDSYRSPWSNKYDPPLEDGAMPSARLRKLEVEANNAFDQYRDLYFEGGVSSVYLWDLDHGFAGVILIKKAGDGSKKIKGCWDSIHVVEVQEKSSGRTAHYKLTSTVMLWLQTNKSGSGTMNLGGSLTRQIFTVMTWEAASSGLLPSPRHPLVRCHPFSQTRRSPGPHCFVSRCLSGTALSEQTKSNPVSHDVLSLLGPPSAIYSDIGRVCSPGRQQAFRALPESRVSPSTHTSLPTHHRQAWIALVLSHFLVSRCSDLLSR